MEKIMKLKALAAITALSLGSSLALADSYRSEFAAAYDDFDGDVKTLLVGGAFYFDQVDTSGKPLAEAAFLNKASNVSLIAGTADINGASDNVDTVGAGVEFYVPNTILYVAADVTRWSVGDDSDNNWTATLGVTPIDGLLVTTQYDDDVDYEFNVQAKYVTQLAGETALNLEAGHANSDFDDYNFVAADYYFNRAFSIGAMIEDQSESAYTLRTNYFINEQFYVGGSYTSYDNADEFMIQAGIRF